MKPFIYYFFILLLFLNNNYSQNTFVNPIINGGYPDPSIMRVDDDFYIDSAGNILKYMKILNGEVSTKDLPIVLRLTMNGVNHSFRGEDFVSSKIK